MHDDDKYHYDDFIKEKMVDFEDEFGKPTSVEPVPSQVMEKYQDKLPKSLLAYWQKEGFCGYL
ncbi:MAG: GAD-like domain-containing protein, partial [Pontiella sp.]